MVADLRIAAGIIPIPEPSVLQQIASHSMTTFHLNLPLHLMTEELQVTSLSFVIPSVD